MRLRPVVSRPAALAPLLLLAACVVQDSGKGAAESAADEFFKFILIFVIIGIVGAIVWALLLAGGVAAILTGIKRVKNPPPPPAGTLPPAQTPAQNPPPEGAGPPVPPVPGSSQPPPPIPTGDARKDGPDSFGIALIVFGGVLVLAAGPFVFGDNGFGTNVRIPLPLLIGAGVLVVFGLRRRRN